MRRDLLLILPAVGWLWAVLPSSHAADGAPKPDPKAEYIRKLIPEKITGEYEGGKLLVLRVHDRNAYVVTPKGKVDPQKRWVWIFPFWLGVNDGHGRLHHRHYVEKYLAAGFSVAGIDVGTSCASPAAARVCHEFYEKVRAEHGLCARARLEVQSNGGLIGYAWAFRHPDCMDRIGGICPVTDFRTWPPPSLATVLSAGKGPRVRPDARATDGPAGRIQPD